MRQVPRVVRRDKLPGKLAPDADSAACRLMRDLFSLAAGIVPRVSDGGRIGHRQKRVKVDFSAGKSAVIR